MNAQGVAIERRLGRPILSSLHAAFSFGGFAGAALGALAATLSVAPLPHLAFAALLFGIPGLVAIGPLLREDADADAHAPALTLRRLPSRLALLGAACFFCLMAEGGSSDWSAKLVRDHLVVGEVYLDDLLDRAVDVAAEELSDSHEAASLGTIRARYP